ncbi:MAG: hypothetical protein QOD77_1665 [Thermoplasmata archaeon]|jgi:hypothetical protein|nr:hypothetical protein [Thermoplasmata archaeon]
MIQFASLRANVSQQALEILQHPDAVLHVGKSKDASEIYEVLGPKTGATRITVWKGHDDLWHCDDDHHGHANQDAPCIHLIVAFVRLQHIAMPNTAATVHRKGRDRAAERRAWRRMAKRFPEVLQAILEAGVPAIMATPKPEPEPKDKPEPGAEPDAAKEKGGHPKRDLRAVVHQAVMRVQQRVSFEASSGLDNPWGACCASTLERFHADPDSARIMEMLVALSTWPLHDLERRLDPDGTGLSPQHFRAYYDERYRRSNGKKKPKKSKLDKLPPNAVLSAVDLRRRAREAEAEAKRLASLLEKPRKHTWAFAEFLWGYESTAILSYHFQDSPFGEAPRFLALLERARFMLEVKEIGGDKAYDANYIFQYADYHGIEAHIKIRDTGIPTNSDHSKKYRKAAMLGSIMDPEGHEAKANLRNNAETGNAAFKARLGDEIYCKGRRRDGKKDATALQVEVGCMVLAWNIQRLIHMEERHPPTEDRPGVVVDFTEGAERLRSRPWRSLSDMERELRKRFPPKGEGGVREQWKP